MADPTPDTLPTTLPEFVQQAQALLPDPVHAYFATGAGDEYTLADNELAWRRIKLRQRVMRGVADRDLSVEILGRRRPQPFIVAPSAWQVLAHPEGETGLCLGAAAVGSAYVQSCWASTSFDDLAAGAPDAVRWAHTHFFKDRGLTWDHVDRAVAGGFEAIAITVDQPVAGRRDRTMRSSFVRPLSPNIAPRSPELDPAQNWDDIAELVRRSPLPVVAKGVMEPEDAVTALEVGCKAVVVSNHGGRQLDTVPSTAAVLADVVDAVDGRGNVLVDGGIRRGTDALKALAIGADAVLIGRPLLWALAVGGAAGVQRALEIFVTELDLALAIIGLQRIEDLDRSAVHLPSWMA